MEAAFHMGVCNLTPSLLIPGQTLTINTLSFQFPTFHFSCNEPLWAPTPPLRRLQSPRPQRKPPRSENRPLIHIPHLASHEPVMSPRLHRPRKPQPQVCMVELRARIYRHRHRAVAEDAGASDLFASLIVSYLTLAV